MNWLDVSSFVTGQPFYKDFEILKGEIVHPSRDGFSISLGELKGQIADWRRGLDDGSCLHVLEYATKYLLHRDKRNPNTDPVGHLVEDAPHWLVVIGIGLVIGAGALLAYVLSRETPG